MAFAQSGWCCVISAELTDRGHRMATFQAKNPSSASCVIDIDVRANIVVPPKIDAEESDRRRFEGATRSCYPASDLWAGF